MDKETFRKEAQKKIDFLAEKIEELQKKLEPMANDAKNEAKIAGEKSLVELKELKAKLDVQFEKFQHVAGAKWEEAMKVFDAASEEIIGNANSKVNKIWERLKGIFE